MVPPSCYFIISLTKISGSRRETDKIAFSSPGNPRPERLKASFRSGSGTSKLQNYLYKPNIDTI